MTRARGREERTLRTAGVLLGIGLGGLFDGIVLHQILQWHHMVSSTDQYPATTLRGLEANTLGDGLFHAATWVLTLVGLGFLWRALDHWDAAWPSRRFVGLLLLGWGAFNVVEGAVDHHLLELHHVRENSVNQLAWDIAFLVWGAGMLVVGWLLARGDATLSGERST